MDAYESILFCELLWCLVTSGVPIPSGILQIPVFSVPVALFSQESRFLFRRNCFLPPQKSCLYGAYVGSYVGLEKEQSKDLVRTRMLQPAPSHITNKH